MTKCKDTNLKQKKQSPAKLVNPNIGTLGHLLTSTKPILALPHGMMQSCPAVHRKTGGERYVRERIYGFHVGKLVIMPAVCGCTYGEKTSSMDHDFETAAPFFYRVLLEEDEIQAEMSVTGAGYRGCFRYGNRDGSTILIKGPAQMETVVRGKDRIAVSLGPEEQKEYEVICFSGKIQAIERYEHCQDVYEDGCCVAVRLDREDSIDISVGCSYICEEFAYRQAEMSRHTAVADVALAAEQIWDEALSNIEVNGGSREQQVVFYTGLYRSLLKMRNITEFGKYRGYDGNIHDTAGRDYYTSDNMWDSFRCKHPLQLILEPSSQEDMVQSYVRMYKQSGWLAQFPEVWGNRAVMLGNHTAAFIWDTYSKGFQNFDVETAYQAVKKNAVEHTKLPWAEGEKTDLDVCYEEKGFFPALKPGEAETEEKAHPFERRQAVSVTLEHAYDDWCAAQLARALSKEEDYRYFMGRAGNYRNVYCGETGFMSPRTKDGSWVEGFDPKYGGGLGGRDYFAECNSWIFSFFVPHDIEGLMELMGGKKGLEDRLDALFEEGFDGQKFRFLAQFPDATGLIGQYCQGNEPAFHIPYLYNFTDSPWKTQRIVRRIMDLWYRDSPLGICGDDDEGAMSSWYVFSAMGLYPVCVGKPVYAIGSPLFEETALHLADGRTFTIRAEETSPQNKYIQNMTLNGNTLEEPFLQDVDLRSGGILVLEMGNRPKAITRT